MAVKVGMRDVTKEFVTDEGDTLTVIDGLSLEVEDHEFVVVLGPSGCGKSTLLYMIGGFERPTSGSVEVDGAPVNGPGRDRGIVFQEYALLPWKSVRDNIGLGLRIGGTPKAERDRRCASLISRMGLEGFADTFPHKLSGGMKQRVAIARTLAYDPGILLMDEPFGALDAQTRWILIQELQRIWMSDRKTVVFVTHSVEEAVHLADRIVILSTKPARVKDVVRVDLPRPRSADAAFAALVERIHGAIGDDALKAMMQAPG